MTQAQQTVPSFNELGISPNILDILSKFYTQPTPIQHKVIPLAIAGNDIVGIAQTGTGKTLAFGIPMLQLLAKNKGQGLILLPTRELALQVEEMLQKIGRSFNLKTAVLIGGTTAYHQVRALHQNPHIVVATPGRLIDHLKQRNYTLNNVTMIVLDEADRMLDIGFAPQIKEILSKAPKIRQTMLFSATMPAEVAKISALYMKNPMRIEVSPAGTSSANIQQEAYIAGVDVKMQLLDKMLADHPGTVLVFSRTKHGAKKLTHTVRAMGHTATEIHSNRSLAQRKEALQGFKMGRYRVLVATDIASRGIDVTNISLVINYDLPDNTEDYVHRIGRTGRAGNKGKAVSFVAPNQRMEIRYIEKLIRKPLQINPLPVLPPRRAPVVIREEDDNRFARAHSFSGSRYKQESNRRRYR